MPFGYDRIRTSSRCTTTSRPGAGPVPYHVLVTGDGLRDAEWVILAYFAYVAILVTFSRLTTLARRTGPSAFSFSQQSSSRC